MSLVDRFFGRSKDRPKARKAALQLETLESRVTPYSVSGSAWAHPDLVSLSFVPDGTLMDSDVGGQAYNDLNAKLGAKFSASTWRAEILKAAQLWAQHTNLNFTVIADNGATSGQGSYQQGDPAMGDIRIGGYGFNNNYLAGAYLPPPSSNYSIAGDFNFNTKQTWNIGTTYDLQTVAMHEVGHALGLLHSSTGTAMASSYGGMRRSLSTDDIQGIQAIYGARRHDTYDTAARNESFASSSNLNSVIDPSTGKAVVNRLDITTTSDVDFYVVTAPSGTSGTLTVNVQSSGLSLLRQKLMVYAADQTTVLGSAVMGSSEFMGGALTLTINGVQAGQTYYLRVSGADTTAFGTGVYGLRLSFGTSDLPALSYPNTQVLAGEVTQGGGGIATEKLMDMYSKSATPDHHHHDDHGGEVQEGPSAGAGSKEMVSSKNWRKSSTQARDEFFAEFAELNLKVGR